MSYTELENQPQWWVDYMLLWLNQKARAEEIKHKSIKK